MLLATSVWANRPAARCPWLLVYFLAGAAAFVVYCAAEWVYTKLYADVDNHHGHHAHGHSHATEHPDAAHTTTASQQLR